MKTIILTILLAQSLNAQTLSGRTLSQSPITKCEKASLQTARNDRKIEWETNATTETKWAVIQNKDTNQLYPKELVKNNKGVIYLSDLPKNKNGYNLILVETTQDENQRMSEDLKSCSLKGDCTLKLKLKGCILAEKKL